MSTVIVGGGISGLSAAWTLARAGREVTVVEPGPFGGLLRTEIVDGCTVECGADSWIRAKPWLRDLAIEAGLAGEILPCNPTQPSTFIFRGGRLLPYPRGMRMVAPTEWRPIWASQLIGWRTKVHMLREMRRKPLERTDRSIADFVSDHFGHEALEYLAEPLFAGVYGGSPEQLGAQAVLPKLVAYERTVGSLIRGARMEPAASGPIFESLKRGLGSIPEALVSQLQGRVRFVRATADSVRSGGVHAGGDWLPADHVVLACGALPAARLLNGTPPSELLSAIPHSSASIFAFGFDSSTIPAPRGFGFLVPRKERQTILAATWVTNKFSGRAPSGTVVLRCFVSGDHSESSLPAVLSDLKRIASIDAPPLFTRVYRWPDSLPQFGINHGALVQQISASMPAGVSLAGAFLGAVGMPDCARSGAVAAAQ